MAAKTRTRSTRQPRAAAPGTDLDSIQAAIVAKVIDTIQTNPGDWTRPWRTALGAGMPTNPVTGKDYQGGNVLWFLAVAMDRGYDRNAWAGYGQWQDHGLQVRRGEKATTGIYWAAWERIETNTAGEERTRRGLTPRPFKVFNVAQVDPISDPADPHYAPAKAERLLERCAPVDRGHAPIDHAEAFFAAVGARVSTGGIAAYSPAVDYIVMPPLGAFDTAEDFYATLAHEHIHWTGHRSRLARPGVVDGAMFASAQYAAEELVAELGAVFLGATLGLDVQPRQDANHAAYLAHWVAAMEAEPKVLWQAAGAASKAAGYLAERAAPVEPVCCAWCTAAGI